MGSAQSARKLTVENQEDVILISESIAERLIHKANEPNINVTNEVRSTALTEPLHKTPISPQVSHSGDIPVYSGYPQLTLTALQIQQIKEQELRNQDNYWQNRLLNLEQKHSKINDTINAEYEKAVKQLYINGKKAANLEDFEPPCKSNTEKVLQCYQNHPKEILKCSTLLEEFSSCVDQRRARIIATRC